MILTTILCCIGYYLCSTIAACILKYCFEASEADNHLPVLGGLFWPVVCVGFIIFCLVYVLLLPLNLVKSKREREIEAREKTKLSGPPEDSWDLLRSI